MGFYAGPAGSLSQGAIGESGHFVAPAAFGTQAEMYSFHNSQVIFIFLGKQKR